MQFKEFLYHITEYLEDNYYCRKHKIEHTGKNAYALDFYSVLNETDKAKNLIFKIIAKAKQNGDAWVFYPGSFNHYNKCNNIVDCGCIVDSLSSFLIKHKNIFTTVELNRIDDVLKKVVYTYLTKAVLTKPVTNQRLWGLTGLAAYYDYKKDEALVAVIKQSLQISLDEMTTDGFFLYHPSAVEHKSFSGYSGLTTFYQSRCTAFIYYVIAKTNLDLSVYQDKLEQSIVALISMYKQEGYKDLNLECKHWYWLSDYEVASHAFDIYALAKSDNPLAKQVLNKSLAQVKKHIIKGYLHSHVGHSNNYQCNLFWNAHLAWLIRVQGIEQKWLVANEEQLNLNIRLDKVVNIINNNQQIILNKLWLPRNFTAGTFNNGLPEKYNKKFFRFTLLLPNKNILLSIRESFYHCKVALRGGHWREFFTRLIKLIKGVLLSIIPIYQLKYSKIDKFNWQGNELTFNVVPTTRYGMILDNRNYKITITE